MKKTFIILGIFTSLGALAQNIGINNSGVAADNSAALDVVASDKGVLIPRVNIADLSTTAPVTSPATSLLVYNTNTTTGEGYYYWDNTKWVKLLDGNTPSDADWFKAGTTSSATSINDNIYTQGKIGIGLTSPVAVLDIIGDVAINRTEVSGGYRSWMVDGIRIGAGGSDNAYFGMKDEGTNNADAVIAWGDDAGDHLRFINVRSGGSANGNEYMRITSEGRIGIGTTAPSSVLHIAHNTPVVKIQDKNNEDTDNGFYGWIGGYDQSGDEIWWLGEGSGSSKTLGFFTNRNYDLNIMNNGAGIVVKTSGNVGIGTSTPSASSVLELSSTNQGVLLPRVALTSTTSASPISSPATSLLVYNTATANDVVPGYYYWDGSKWLSFVAPKKKQITINAYSTGLGGSGSRSVYLNGNSVSTSARGVHLTVVGGTTGTVVFSQSYDTHGNTALGTNCANDINAYNTNGNILILNTWDQPNHINADLTTALRDVMQSKQIVYETMDYRGAFCIIYQNGRGKLAESTTNSRDDTGNVIGNGNSPRANTGCHVVTFLN